MVTDGSLEIVGSLSSSAMFIVPNGSISFTNKDCENSLVAKDQGYKDEVSGIFISKNGFSSNAIKNTDMNVSWCFEG